MTVKMLVDRYSVHEEVEEQKRFWLLSLLYTLGVDVDAFEEVDEGIFDDYLLSMEIEIIEYTSMGALKVICQGETVGEWAGADLALKSDEYGKYYFEATIEEWSILDEEIDNSED